MYDVLCIGNALVDAFLSLPKNSESCRINHETKELCFPADEKIIVETASFFVGGNACNVSVGLSRLGLRTSLIVEIGNDAFSNKILKTLEKEGVDHSHVKVENALSSFGMDIMFGGERVHLVHHVRRDHSFSYENIDTAWVYLSSLGEEWEHVYQKTSEFVKRKNRKLACNPGTRQIDKGLAVLESSLAASEILFLNKEEAEKLLQVTPGSVEIKSLLERLQKLGPKTVVITDGKHGSFVVNSNGNYYHQAIVPSEVVEKTGAGDSFATGFLAATMYGNDLQTALEWGSVNAASVIGKVGAQPGLLSRQVMEERVRNLS